MKESRMTHSPFKLGLLLVPVALLTGCNWLSTPSKERPVASTSAATGNEPFVIEDGSAVLVTMNGKPVVTVKSLDAEFEQILNENPQLRSILPLMPDAKSKFAQGMISQIVVDRFVADEGIDRSAKYVEEMDALMKQARRSLNTKYFSELHPISVSAADVRKFYEENKDTMPELIMSRGGVQAVGVRFDNEQAAVEFLGAARSAGNVQQAASTGSVPADRIRDFKIVNAQSSGIDPVLRTKIMAINRFPSFELIKLGDNEYWIVEASGKQETKYRPFEQVQAGLEQLLEREKRMDVFEKEINKLKTRYGVAVSKELEESPEGIEVDEAAMMAMQAQALEEAQQSSNAQAL